MAIVLFLFMLLITIQVTNKKNNTKATNEVLEFTKMDSFIIFLCFLGSILVEFLSKKFFNDNYFIVTASSSVFFLMVLIIVNKHREDFLKNKQDQIIKTFQALADIFGKVKIEDIDFSNVPFEIEEDKKLKQINQIKIDTSIDGIRVNDNTVTLAQYSLNKFFPELQWISKVNYSQRELIFKGLPKPPDIAKFPGSDYRPTGWIPLGLSGEGEVGWNLSNPKSEEMGSSSYISENGKAVNTVKIPSAPQALCLGSTGGGKSIYVEQVIDIK